MSPELIQKIESFLTGDIEKNALEAYAQEKNISDLNENISWVKNAQIAVEATGLQDQLKTLFAVEKKKEAKVRKLGFTKKLWAAAAAVLLLVTGYWVNQNSGNENLYAEFEYKDSGLPVVMGQSEDYAFDDAMTYFNEENYIEAAKKFGAINTVEKSDTLSYYLGLSQWYADNTILAKEQLTVVAQNSNSTFKEKAEWILILADLKANDNKAARAKLGPITSDTNHQFNSQAKALLLKIPAQ